MASLGNYTNSQDVLQRTNLTLWRKAGEFRAGAPFMPWALAVARFEVLAFLRDHRRERLVFQPDVVELMCGAAAAGVSEIPDRRHALRDCLNDLSEKNRQLLNLRYVRNQPLAKISEMTERSIDGVKSLLLRIRKSLGKCIEKKLTAET